MTRQSNLSTLRVERQLVPRLFDLGVLRLFLVDTG